MDSQRNKRHNKKRIRPVDIEKIKKRGLRAFKGMGVILVVLLCVLLVQTHVLNTKKDNYQAQYESLQSDYVDESEQSAQLESQKIYVQTKQYLESVAREKLGLVNKDEVLIKSKDD